eukprot:TRINITY_DN14814_c0_g1_i1.p1 TRINITY_DN14814_c0_g1~~TRINITY_DN14814_c0_g1_i1.p1  ORF type:complete len:1619 (-),score=300.47 TRINITY_DN14814_c0_g1_i1:181-5037(-)
MFRSFGYHGCLLTAVLLGACDGMDVQHFLLPLPSSTTGRLDDERSMNYNKWSCDNEKEKDKECQITKSKNFTKDMELHYEGDVVIYKSVIINAAQHIKINATGTLTLQESAVLRVAKDVSIFAGDVTIQSKAKLNASGCLAILMNGESSSELTIKDGAALQSGGDTTLVIGAMEMTGSAKFICRKEFRSSTSEEGGTGCDRLHLGDSASIMAGSMSFLCADGDVNISDKAALRTCDLAGKIDVWAESFYAWPGATFATTSINTTVQKHLHFNSSALPGYDSSSCNGFDLKSRTGLTTLFLATAQDMVISPLIPSNWQVSRLIAAGANVFVQGFSIRTGGGNWCRNYQTPKVDRCNQILGYWNKHLDGAASVVSYAAAWGNASTATFRVSFDVAIVAKEGLTVNGSKILAASLLICAGLEATISNAAVFDVSARGCGVGEGVGAGSSQDPRQSYCGGSGGSHVGQAGNGGTFMSASMVTMPQVTKCACAPYPYDFLKDGLPTTSASGGGYGCEPNRCPQPAPSATVPFAAGGGLILVAANSLYFTADVALKADGSRGDTIHYTPGGVEPNATLVSGGGAGGQILIYAGRWVVTPAGPKNRLLLSTSGGPGYCTDQTVSGGGGGGFIGLQWLGLLHVMVDVSDLVSINVTGGQLSPDCDGIVPSTGLGLIYAWPGLATSISPCAAGSSGLFCKLCGVGNYSVGGSECMPCTNAPSSGSYYQKGWPNATCPYNCNPGTANVDLNPECLNAWDYALVTFGGTAGIIAVTACFLVVCACMLWRRNCARYKRYEHRDQGASFHASRIGNARPSCRRRLRSACTRLLPCLWWWRKRTSREQLRRDISGGVAAPASSPRAAACNRFTKELLPYHVCRVYVVGDNYVGCAWELDHRLPDGLDGLVLPERWQAFVKEVNSAAAIGRVETVLLSIVRLLYPPLTLPLARNFRLGRMKKLQRQCRDSSTGHNGRRFWQSRPAGIDQLAMLFGCDPGATLGYFDVFDFTREQMDWAPLDLLREARLLVAHGDGSYANPYAIDITDPLVMNLSMQTETSAQAICSVIATFNRLSRLARHEDVNVYDAPRSPAIARIRTKVERCAAMCGLGGLVHVLALQVPLSCNAKGGTKKNGLQNALSATVGGSMAADFTDLLPPSLPQRGESEDKPNSTAPSGSRSPDVMTLSRRGSGDGSRLNSNDTILLEGGETAPRPGSPSQCAWKIDAGRIGDSDRLPRLSDGSPTLRQPRSSSSSTILPDSRLDCRLSSQPPTSASRLTLGSGRPSSYLSHTFFSQDANTDPSQASPATVVPEDRSGMASSAAAAAGQRLVPVCLKLGLAFTRETGSHTSSTSEHSFFPSPRHGHRSLASAGPMPHGGLFAVPLTSPISRQELLDHLHSNSVDYDIDGTMRSQSHTALSGAKWLSLSWRDRAGAMPSLVAVSLLGLLFADALIDVLVLHGLWQSGLSGAAFMWNLLPPFAEPVALALGAVFLIIEDPWLGRCFAAFELCSICGPVVSTCWIVVVKQVNSWAFNTFLTLLIIAVKFAAMVAAALHVWNLEAARDLKFVEASQSEFLGDFLSSGVVRAVSDEDMDVEASVPMSMRGSYCRSPTFRETFHARISGLERGAASSAAPF